MARRGQAKPRDIEADPIYKDILISKLINRAMIDGKKNASQKEVYGAMELIKKETNDEPMKTFEQAMNNIRPQMEVRPRRVGGAAYQIPMPVRGARKDSLAIRWLIAAARNRSNSEFHTFAEKLAREIIDSAKGEGAAVKKRLDMEKMAEANRAFAHFRW